MWRLRNSVYKKLSVELLAGPTGAGPLIVDRGSSVLLIIVNFSCKSIAVLGIDVDFWLEIACRVMYIVPSGRRNCVVRAGRHHYMLLSCGCAYLLFVL